MKWPTNYVICNGNSGNLWMILMWMLRVLFYTCTLRHILSALWLLFSLLHTKKKISVSYKLRTHTHTHTKMRHSLFLHSFFFSFFFNRDYTKSTLCTKSTYNLYCSFIITIFVAGAVVAAAAAAHFIQHFKLILLFISSICLFFVFEDLFYFLGMVYFALFELPLERSFVNLMNSQNYDLLYEFECWHYRNEIVLKNLVECPGKK